MKNVLFYLLLSLVALTSIAEALKIFNASQMYRNVLSVRKHNLVQRRSFSSSRGYRNYCYNRPCRNGGMCVNTRHSFKCNCGCGFTGHVCESNIDDCADHPCGDYGHCTDKVNGYRCRCSPGFTGKVCEEDVDDCVNRPCGDNGQCIDIINGFYCKCNSGFTGKHCGEDINDCDSNPCENGGMCQNGVDNFSCLCDGTGFTGKLCECNIDDCASNPCGENGRCTDEISGFNCVCDDGFTGDNCEMDINDCASNPCGNGSCSDKASGFNCLCFEGYKGNNCEIACDTPFDIVIAVDSTEDADTFSKLTNGITNGLGFYFIEPALRNVGVVSFGPVTGDVINITGDIDQLAQRIRALGYPGVGTNTRLGIEKAQMLLETRGRPDIPDVMIVIVNGKTDISGDPIPAATDAKSKGTDIYVIGFGDVDFDELRVIASADSKVKLAPNIGFTELLFEQITLQIC